MLINILSGLITKNESLFTYLENEGESWESMTNITFNPIGLPELLEGATNEILAKVDNLCQVLHF